MPPRLAPARFAALALLLCAIVATGAVSSASTPPQPATPPALRAASTPSPALSPVLPSNDQPLKFQRIVTQCPHCFNALKNEYPQFGADFPVQHYTEYLVEAGPSWGEISPNGHGLKGQVAYHDSCYLGRYNQIYEAPRQLLQQVQVKPIEFSRHGENSFCCGGGGGQMWLETDAETRINHRRLNEALQAKADIVATACPYCLLMFDDAIRSKGLGEQVQVLDIAEIMERQALL